MAVESSYIESSVPGIPSRNIHVYLPPGYNPAATGYPVMYMHDGQNVFAPGTEFGCWYAGKVADDEINAGRIPPFIIVAIDNNGDNRRHEYVPPGDQYKDWKPGAADKYAQFIINDIIPFVAEKYNITAKRSETIIAGSSLGGVVSLYLGFETDAFGIIGSMSTAICWAENFLKSLPARSGKPLRIYHDVGTTEPREMAPDDYDAANKQLHQNVKKAGCAEPDNLKFVIDEGGRHNESDWCRRLPEMLRWMFGV